MSSKFVLFKMIMTARKICGVFFSIRGVFKISKFQDISRISLENGEFQDKIPGQKKFQDISRISRISRTSGHPVTWNDSLVHSEIT